MVNELEKEAQEMKEVECYNCDHGGHIEVVLCSYPRVTDVVSLVMDM